MKEVAQLNNYGNDVKLFHCVVPKRIFLSKNQYGFPNFLVCKKTLDQAGKCILSQFGNLKLKKNFSNSFFCKFKEPFFYKGDVVEIYI